MANPDEIVWHRPDACAGCGNSLDADAKPVGFTWGQIFDLPDPRLTVTEYRMLKLRCGCGHTTARARQRACAR